MSLPFFERTREQNSRRGRSCSWEKQHQASSLCQDWLHPLFSLSLCLHAGRFRLTITVILVISQKAEHYDSVPKESLKLSKLLPNFIKCCFVKHEKCCRFVAKKGYLVFLFVLWCFKGVLYAFMHIKLICIIVLNCYYSIGLQHINCIEYDYPAYLWTHCKKWVHKKNTNTTLWYPYMSRK